jgi:hypothetical protein
MSSHNRHTIITSAPFLCVTTLIWGVVGSCFAGNTQTPQFISVPSAFGAGTGPVLATRVLADDPAPRREDYTNYEDYVRAVLEWIMRNTGGKASDLDGHTLSQQVFFVAAYLPETWPTLDLTPDERSGMNTVSQDLTKLFDPEMNPLLVLQLHALGLEIEFLLDK